MKTPDMIAAAMNRWFDPDNKHCWRCFGKGSWYEQIDGPDNLRKVDCDNPIHYSDEEEVTA